MTFYKSSVHCYQIGLRNVFSVCGAIQNVYIQKQPGPVVEKMKSFFNVQEKLVVSVVCVTT
jgi:hypothetical protein